LIEKAIVDQKDSFESSFQKLNKEESVSSEGQINLLQMKVKDERYVKLPQDPKKVQR